MRFEVVESFLASKSGEVDRCEDVLGVGESWAIVCDGATDKSGLQINGETVGRAIARATVQAVLSATSEHTAAGLVDRINAACNRALGPHLATTPIYDLPTCSFVALETASGLVVRVGDTSWRTEYDTHIGGKAIDEVHANMRSAYLRMLILEGAEVTRLLDEDPGRAVILPSLRKQGLLRNNEVAGFLGYGAIDGRPVPTRYVETWHLGDAREVVLASDGYPQLFMTLGETESYLAKDLEADPLRIGRHATTKSIRPGHLSFDDRAYLRLRRST